MIEYLCGVPAGRSTYPADMLKCILGVLDPDRYVRIFV